MDINCTSAGAHTLKAVSLVFKFCQTPHDLLSSGCLAAFHFLTLQGGYFLYNKFLLYLIITTDQQPRVSGAGAAKPGVLLTDSFYPSEFSLEMYIFPL